MILVERKACCYIANAFLSRLQPIWLISRQLKMPKMPPKCFFLNKAVVVEGLMADIFFYKGSGGKGQTRFVSKTIKNDSFFNFFSPPEGQ